MPSKYYLRNFTPGYYYHIYNRGAHKADIFKENKDHETFLEIIEYYLKFPTGKPLSYINTLLNREKLEVRNLQLEPELSFVVTCFVLMPNHFHFLVRQKTNPSKKDSIINFMRRINITYAMYFNNKYDHSGSIFEGRYKNLLVKKDEYLIYLTKYIHTNPLGILGKGQSLESYKFSSYGDYIGDKTYVWIENEDVLKLFSQNNPNNNYKKFVEGLSIEDYINNSDSFKKYLLE